MCAVKGLLPRAPPRSPCLYGFCSTITELRLGGQPAFEEECNAAAVGRERTVFEVVKATNIGRG